MSLPQISCPIEKSGLLSPVQDLELQVQDLKLQEMKFQDDFFHINIMRSGEDLRQWQVEARRERHRPLLTPILLLARRLLAEYRNWEVQVQEHLDYSSLEVRVRPDTELILIECRRSESVHLDELGALELCLVSPLSFSFTSLFPSFEGTSEVSPDVDSAENAQTQDVQTQNFHTGSLQTSVFLKTDHGAEKLTDFLESFLLQVVGTAECIAPTYAEHLVEVENLSKV